MPPLLALCCLYALFFAGCSSSQPSIDVPEQPEYEYTPADMEAIERLSQAIQFRTISYEDTLQTDYEPYDAFINFLEEQYPQLHAEAPPTRIGGYSLLFKWEGTRTDLKPALLLGHYDVVPVSKNADSLWTYPPFSGKIADGFVWGRGALDDKSGIMSMLEAAEQLIEEGFRPPRTMYFALHHDEEIGGLGGAKRVAAHLQEQGVELEFLVDEGTPIAVGLVENVEPPIAFIGVAEKGYVNIEMTYRQEGGHASMPPRMTVISTLSEAIGRIEQRPMQAYYKGIIRETFDPIIPYMPFWQRLAFNNTWLFRRLIVRGLGRNPVTNASLRTTAAKTIFEAGFKENVLPGEGRVILNFRIHPNDSVQDVERYVRRTIGNPDIQVRVMDRAREASPISDTDAPPYLMLRETIEAEFEGALISPTLFVAASDSRHFHELTSNVYRFRPIRATPDDRGRVHGIDERIGTHNYLEMISFQKRLIRSGSRDLNSSVAGQ